MNPIDNIVTLDFETHYSTKSGYSLSKMTTEEYVRDERFAALALGYKIDTKLGWVPAAHIKEFLDDVDWRGAAVLCHHAHFDGLILSTHYDLRPAFFLDTMSMARAWWPGQPASLEALAKRLGLPPKTVPYNAFDGAHPNDLYKEMGAELIAKIGEGASHDCELTEKLFYYLLNDGFPYGELPIIDMTAQMFTNPKFKGDVELFKRVAKVEKDHEDALMASLGLPPYKPGTKHPIGSSNMFAKLLEDQGINVTEEAMKQGKNRPIYAFAATDDFMKEHIDDENKAIATFVRARLAVKSNIRETRSTRLAAAAGRGALPCYLNYFGATRTGRWSGGDGTNWQNFPRPDEDDKRELTLGDCVAAPEGHVLVIADASQIECRILNYVAGQSDTLQAFKDGRDIYCEIASEIFGREISKSDKHERFVGKRTELSCGYGIGHMKLLSLGVDNAYRAVTVYRSRHPMVCALWKEGDQILNELYSNGSGTWLRSIICFDHNRIWLPNDTFLEFHLTFDEVKRSFIHTDQRGIMKLWGGALTGQVVQALASVYLREVIFNIVERTGHKPLVLIHDSAVYAVRECDAELMLKQVKEEFKRAPKWLGDIPLDCDARISETLK